MGQRLDMTDGICLRFIFNGAVVSLALTEDATIADIARILGSLPGRRYGEPIAIDVTLATSETAKVRRSFSESICAWPRIVGSRNSATEQFVLAHRASKERERADSGYDAG